MNAAELRRAIGAAPRYSQRVESTKPAAMKTMPMTRFQLPEIASCTSGRARCRTPRSRPARRSSRPPSPGRPSVARPSGRSSSTRWAGCSQPSCAGGTPARRLLTPAAFVPSLTGTPATASACASAAVQWQRVTLSPDQDPEPTAAWWRQRPARGRGCGPASPAPGDGGFAGPVAFALRRAARGHQRDQRARHRPARRPQHQPDRDRQHRARQGRGAEAAGRRRSRRRSQALTKSLSGGQVDVLQDGSTRSGVPPGLRAMTGPGIVVDLDDAPRGEDVPTGTDPNLLARAPAGHPGRRQRAVGRRRRGHQPAGQPDHLDDRASSASATRWCCRACRTRRRTGSWRSATPTAMYHALLASPEVQQLPRLRAAAVQPRLVGAHQPEPADPGLHRADRPGVRQTVQQLGRGRGWSGW